MKFLSDIIKISYYEFLMHIRSWRFRLSFLIVLILSFLLRKNIYISIIDLESQRLFLLTVFLLLTDILVSVETVGILKKRNIHNILMPKPFSILALSIGRFLSIILLMSFLSILILYLPLIFNIINRTELHFSPSTYLFIFVLLPNIMLVTALTISIRTVFKYDVIAYIITILLYWILIIIIHTFGAYDIYSPYLISLDQLYIIQTLYSPSIGMIVYYFPLIFQIMNTIFLSLFFLTISCYHSRRMEPQRKVLGDYGKRWYHIPTFIKLVVDTKIDKKVGQEVHKSFFILLSYLIISISVYTYFRYDEFKIRKRWFNDEKELVKSPKPDAVPCVGKYTIALTLKNIDEIICSCNMGIYNPTNKSIDRIILSLNKTLRVENISSNNKELNFRRLSDKIFIDLDKPLNPLDIVEIQINYNGHLSTDKGRLLFLKAFALTPYNHWYPQIVEYNKSQNNYSESLASNFRYDLTLNFPKHLVPIVEGDILNTQEEGKRKIFKINLSRSSSNINIIVGNYKHIDKDYGDLKIRFYYLDDNKEVIDFILSEYKDQFERLGKVLGKYITEYLVLYENPSTFDYNYLTISSYDFIRLKKQLPEYKKVLIEDPYNEFKFRKFETFNIYIRTLSTLIINRYVDNCIKTPNETKSFFKEFFKSYLNTYLSPIIERTYYKKNILLNKYTKSRNYDVTQINILDFNKSFPDFKYQKALAIWTMLRFIMGDEKFIKFIQAYLNEFREKLIDEKAFIQLAEKISGDKLDWFLQQWFYSDKIPEFEIKKAFAQMFDDKKTIGMDYKITVIVKNKSQAKTILPVYIETEGDQITQKLLFEPEEEKVINLEVPDRPLFVTIDPDGWIVQTPKWDPETHTRMHDEKKFEIIEL